jgi:uncharacterized protein YoxC
MGSAPPAEEPSPPDYPGHTAAFGRIMHGPAINQGTAQGTVRIVQIDVGDLMKVTDDELLILARLPIAATVGVDLEMARRTLTRTTAAIARLGESMETLRTATDQAGTKTAAAVGQLEASIDALRESTDMWSTWLTRLTIGIFGLTLLLVVLAIAQVLNR